MGQAHTQGSRTMTLPILLFRGGTHGNFLARCLSVSSGTAPDFDFYHDSDRGETKGAHANRNFAKLVNHTHPHPALEANLTHVWCYIDIKLTDLYLHNWHIHHAAGEFGLNLLHVKDFNDYFQLIENNSQHPLIRQGIKNQVNSFKDSGITGLREMFKLSFRSSNGNIEDQKQHHEQFKIANKFNFEWFYNYKNFKHNLIRLLTDLGKEYCYDIEHHWQDFINRKQEAIQSKLAVERAMECFTSHSDMDISNFCIYQQAYLDHLVEQYLDYEIELWHNGYPQNMLSYKPVQATRDEE